MALWQFRGAAAREALTGQESGRSRRCVPVGTAWAEVRAGGLVVLIHSSERSLVSSSQNDPGGNENLTKNTAKALEGNCEGAGTGVKYRAQHSVSQV